MNGQNQVIATGRLVRTTYRPPVIAEASSYLDLLEDQRDQLLEENQGLKTRLSEVQAELDRVLARPDNTPSYKVPRAKPPGAKTRRHWTPGHVRLSDRFPVDLAERTGIAAFIRKPLALRSGAVLEPVQKAAVRGGRSVQFPDSSWLVLSVLAQRAGEWVTRRELADLLFPGRRDSSVRSAVLRARLTLETVQADQDLETSGNFGVGWRLLLAKRGG